MQRKLIVQALLTLLLSGSIVYGLKWNSSPENKQNQLQSEALYLVTTLTLWGSIEGLRQHRRLKQKLNYQLGEIISLDRKLAEISDLRQRLEQDCQNFNTEQAAKNQEIAALYRELKKANASNRKLKQNQTGLIKTVRSDQAQTKQLQSQAYRLLFQRLALLTMMQKQSERIQMLLLLDREKQSQISTLKQLLQQKEAEHQAVIQQVDRLVDEGIEYLDQNEILELDRDRTTAQYQALIAQNAQLQFDYAQHDRALKTLQIDYKTLRSDRDVLQTEYDKLAQTKKALINSFETEVIQVLKQSRQCQKQDWVIEEAFIVSTGSTSYLLDAIVFGKGFVAVIEAKYYPGLIRSEGDPANGAWFVHQKSGYQKSDITQGRRIRCAAFNNPHKQVMVYTQELNKRLENRRNSYQKQVLFTRAYGIALFPSQADLTEIQVALNPGRYCQVTTLDRLTSAITQLQNQTYEAQRDFQLSNSRLLEAKDMRKLLFKRDIF